MNVVAISETIDAVNKKFLKREHAVHCYFAGAGWGVFRKDQQGSAEAAEKYEAEEHMINQTKAIIDPKTPSYKAIKTIRDKGSNTCREMTAASAGVLRIITNLGLPKLRAVMADIEREHDLAVETFIRELPEIIAAAEIKAGTAFDRNLIPDAEVIRARFKFDFTVLMIPVEDTSIMAGLEPEHRAELQRELDANTTKWDAEVKADLQGRLLTELNRAKDALAKFGDVNPDAKKEGTPFTFRDSLVTRLDAIADLAVALNITGDQRLNDLSADIKDRLTSVSGIDLRGTEKIAGDNRTEAVREAEAAKHREKAIEATDEIMSAVDTIFG
tara:strand:- start:2057 stop:3043 length:987 start_codon:yes stop_codon:yes gene_type:complete